MNKQPDDILSAHERQLILERAAYLGLDPEETERLFERARERKRQQIRDRELQPQPTQAN